MKLWAQYPISRPHCGFHWSDNTLPRKTTTGRKQGDWQTWLTCNIDHEVDSLTVCVPSNKYKHRIGVSRRGCYLQILPNKHCPIVGPKCTPSLVQLIMAASRNRQRNSKRPGAQPRKLLVGRFGIWLVALQKAGERKMETDGKRGKGENVQQRSVEAPWLQEAVHGFFVVFFLFLANGPRVSVCLSLYPRKLPSTRSRGVSQEASQRKHPAAAPLSLSKPYSIQHKPKTQLARTLSKFKVDYWSKACLPPVPEEVLAL